MRGVTYEFLGFTFVFNLDDWLSTFGYNLEGEMLEIRLHFSVVEFATNKTLGIEYTVTSIY